VAVTDYDQLSLGDLGQRLGDTLQDLAHKQVLLAKQEANEDLQRAIRAAIWLGVGVVLVLFGVVCLLFALVAATAALSGLPLWAAALIWLLIFAVIGAICLMVGKGRIPLRPLSLTRATLKEDLEWARQRLILRER